MTFIDNDRDFKFDIIKIDTGKIKEVILPFEAMKVGDSFLLPHHSDVGKARRLIANIRGREGYGFWHFKFCQVRVFPKGKPHKARITYRIIRTK